MLQDLEEGNSNNNPRCLMNHRKKQAISADTAAVSSSSAAFNESPVPHNTVDRRDGGDDDDDDSLNKGKGGGGASKTKHNARTTVGRRRKRMIITTGAVVVGTGTILFLYRIAAHQLRLSRHFSLRIVTLLPVALSLYTGVSPRQEKSLQRRILPLTLVLTVVSAQLPTYVAAGLAAAAILAFSVATKPNDTNNKNNKKHFHQGSSTIRSEVAAAAARTNNNSKHPLRNNKQGPTFATVVIAVCFMIAVLLTENFLIWVVSATFEAGQDAATAPPPLQDNGQRVLQHFLVQLSKQQVVGLRRLWNTQWSLVACLGASFVVVELYQQHARRTLYSVATRAAVTVAAARFVRTVSFVLTVIPSQVRNCYAQRFPVPPPTDWMEWIWVGLMPRSHGGCNDLIISGHATITATSTSFCSCYFVLRCDSSLSRSLQIRQLCVCRARALL